MKLDLTTPEGRRKANEALAKLCGWSYCTQTRTTECDDSGEDGGWRDHQVTGWVAPGQNSPYSPWPRPAPPDFLRGLRSDGTCNEAEVDGDLLWKVMRAIEARDCRLLTLRHSVDWCVSFHEPPQKGVGGLLHTQHHWHPVAALALCAAAAGLFEEPTNETA